jgi:alpha-tubulin suppressor-like RCC1 family protein
MWSPLPLVLAATVGNAPGFVDLGGARAVDIAVGSDGACAVTGDGRVLCWGKNSAGQLGLPHQENRQPPTEQPGVTDALRVVLARPGGCVLRRSGQVTCWGSRSRLDGQSLRAPTVLAGAEDHVCAIANGVLRCVGQLGQSGHYTSAGSPIGVRRPVDVVAGWHSDCARDQAGAAWCWGSGFSEDRTSRGLPRPTRLAVPAAADISVAASTVCVATRAGRVLCRNHSGPGFREIEQLRDVVKISVGANHGCALRRDRTVACWPVVGPARPVAGLRDVVQLASGFSNTCARTADGAVTCLGHNAYRELGIDGDTERTRPARVPGLTATKLSTALHHSCALDSRGTLRCWGLRDWMYIGSAPESVVMRPSVIASDEPFVDLVRHGNNVCGVTGRGALTCFGPQPRAPAAILPVLIGAPVMASPSCGIDRKGDVHCPQLVPEARGSVELAVGDGFVCGRQPAGALVCWGAAIPKSWSYRPGHGCIGAGTEIDASPHTVALPPLQRVVAYDWRLCVIPVDGRLGCIELHDRSPWHGGMQYLALGSVRAAGAGIYTSCAILVDGQVTCFGQNRHGQLGIGVIDEWPPAAVRPLEPAHGLRDVTDVRLGAEHACALRKDGAVFCWGDNTFGQLGLGTRGFVLEPPG